MMQTGKTIITVFILAACFAANVSPQSPAPVAFTTLNVADGLPQSYISGLAQDKTGFIWIATRDGLARYDGKKFKTFRHVPGDSTTLASNIIVRLYPDRQDRLWIFYETGDIDVLDCKTENLFHFTKNILYKEVYKVARGGHCFAEDAKGNIWILTNKGGLFACNLEKGQLRFYSEPELGLTHDWIAGISSNKGVITLITNTSLIKLDDNAQGLKTIPYAFHNLHLYDPQASWKDVYAIFRQNGDAVINDVGRIIIYHAASNSFTERTFTEWAQSYDMVEDDKGTIYFNYGVDIYTLSINNEVSRWSPGSQKPEHGFKASLIDRSGILWMGSNGSGVQLYDLRLSRLPGIGYEQSFQEDVLKDYMHVPPAEISKTFLHHISPYSFRWFKTADGKFWFSRAENTLVASLPVCYYKDGHLVQPPWHNTDRYLGNRPCQCPGVQPLGKIMGYRFPYASRLL
ncbi:MAG: two-component regulator propeller domain-containing protein [Bacteroidota bacterium]